MKKLIFTAATVAIIATSAFSVNGAGAQISVTLNGEAVTFKGQDPVIVSDRTLIPLRGVFEKMGYEVGWEPNTKTATIEADGTTVSISAGSSTLNVNGNATQIDVPAQIMNGSMMLPLRAVSEAAGATVNWNGLTKTVEITTGAAQISDVAAASEYLTAFSKAAAPMDELGTLFTELQSLDGEITKTELQSYRVKLYNASQTLQSVKADIEKLAVPAGMEQLQSVRLEAIDKLNEMIELLVDYCDGEVTDAELDTKIRELSAESDDITKRSNEILANLGS